MVECYRSRRRWSVRQRAETRGAAAHTDAPLLIGRPLWIGQHGRPPFFLRVVGMTGSEECEVPKAVIRKDLRGQPVGNPMFCVDPTELAYRPSAHTIEECVQMLLSTEEICLGGTARRQIMNGAKLVGHIEIVDEHR